MHGDRFGIHRVLEPQGVLPQPAWKLDNDTAKIFDDEIVLEVERLNIDSASFVQMEGEGSAAEREARIRAALEKTVRERGKQHNPVTGSGGMLLGKVSRVGAALAPRTDLRPGERVATLISLTLTPLRIDRIDQVDLARHQVSVIGQAILFESSAWARMPSDLPETVALSAFDVAGAAPQVARLVAADRARGLSPRVLILGCGGKSGLLTSAAARKAGAARIIGVERSEEAARFARRLGACDEILITDVASPVTLAALATSAAGGEFDLAVSCVNVPDAEMAPILATRDGGTIYFFSMATQFTKAALGAEGVSRDVNMLIGNGYCPGHAEATLALLREDQALREIFVERYG